jgi:hypothetical protein
MAERTNQPATLFRRGKINPFSGITKKNKGVWVKIQERR